MGEIPDVGASDPPHLRSVRCQAARRAAAAAVLRPLGPPVPCPFHQGPTRPAGQGHCSGSGSGALGPWALTQLPAMQGEVFGLPFGQSREAFRPSPRPTWGWAHGAHTGTHKHRTLPQGRWAPYMQTMLNMQLWGPPWGPSAPPPLGDGPPAVAGLRLLDYDPHPCSSAYQLLTSQHGASFSLASQRAVSGPFFPFAGVPSQGLPLPANVHSPLALDTFDSTSFCVLPPTSCRQCSHRHTNMSLQLPQTCRKSLTLALTHTVTHTWRLEHRATQLFLGLCS